MLQKTKWRAERISDWAKPSKAYSNGKNQEAPRKVAGPLTTLSCLTVTRKTPQKWRQEDLLLFSCILFSFWVLPMILVCLFENFILSRVVCSIINIIFLIFYLFNFTANTELPLSIFVLVTVALHVLFCF